MSESCQPKGVLRRRHHRRRLPESVFFVMRQCASWLYPCRARRSRSRNHRPLPRSSCIPDGTSSPILTRPPNIAEGMASLLVSTPTPLKLRVVFRFRCRRRRRIPRSIRQRRRRNRSPHGRNFGQRKLSPVSLASAQGIALRGPRRDRRRLAYGVGRGRIGLNIRIPVSDVPPGHQDRESRRRGLRRGVPRGQNRRRCSY